MLQVQRSALEMSPRVASSALSTAVRRSTSKVPGKSQLRYPDGSEPVFSIGPQYFNRIRPPNPHGSFSTRSDSKRSSVNQVSTTQTDSCVHRTNQQSKFRIAVIARDSTCLVTDVMYTYCTACHIVPYSRPDVGVCGAVGSESSHCRFIKN